MAKVLAADDSSSIRKMVAFTLKGAGHKVILAEDGVEALDKAKQGVVDLVLTDINMPNMDGICLLKELRELPDYKYTPILVLTTESGSDVKSKGREAGATGWIVKPFNPDKLLATIARILE